MNKPSLNLQDPQIVMDAVRMLKSQFIEFYTKLGYKTEGIGPAWHSLRTSREGVSLQKSVYQGQKHLQAATFISDMEESVKERLKSRLNKVKGTQKLEAPVSEPEVLEPTVSDLEQPLAQEKIEIPILEHDQEATQQNENEMTKKKEKVKPAKEKAASKRAEKKPAKEKEPKVVVPGGRGDKKRAVLEYIEKGEIDVAKIMEATGASKIYVTWLLKQQKK